MSVPPTNPTAGGWRAEEAICSILGFDPGHWLNPRHMTCLSLIKDGSRRCTYFDKMQREEPRCSERRQLAENFQARTAPEDPMDFKDEVMRFIELAVCHRYRHVDKMVDAAEDWFKKHGNEIPRIAAPQSHEASVKTATPPGARSPEVRHYSTGLANGIEMKPYIRGRDENQLRRLIEDPLKPGERREGQLYITVSRDVPGYIKIGYTCQSVESRFAYARRECGINIQLMYTTGLLPHAKRLEAIVHNELADKRCRFAQPCPLCFKTARKHEEWFLTTVEYARGVAEYWKAWLLKGMYDRDRGSLATLWQSEILLSVSPVKIKERERRFSCSPEPECQRNPPDSPTPVGKVTSQGPITAPTLRSTTSKAKDVKEEVVETPKAQSSSPKPKDSQPDETDPPARSQPKASAGPSSNTRRTVAAPAASAGQLIPVTTASPKIRIGEKSVQKERSNEDRRNASPASGEALSVESLVKPLLSIKKDGAETVVSVRGKGVILGTEVQFRARVGPKKEGLV